MLKPGIVRYSDLHGSALWFGRRKLASLLLLRDLARRGSVDPAEYDALIRIVQMSNGVWRDTTKGRLVTVDRALVEAIGDRFPRGSHLVVSDLAASSGTTSVDLYVQLRPRYELEFIASDLARDAIAITSRGLPWTVVFEGRGDPLQYVIGPFVLPAHTTESLAYPVNRLLKRLCKRWLLPRALAVFENHSEDAQADFEAVVAGDYEIVRLPLLSYDCLEVLRHSSDFRFESIDLSERLPHCADVIRAMNILTPHHLNALQIRQGIRNLAEALNPGGLLVLGRSTGEGTGEVSATIYSKEANNLEVVRRVNDGYDQEHLLAGQRSCLG